MQNKLKKSKFMLLALVVFFSLSSRGLASEVNVEVQQEPGLVYEDVEIEEEKISEEVSEEDVNLEEDSSDVLSVTDDLHDEVGIEAEKQEEIEIRSETVSEDDKIYFIKGDNSDCTIIESNGRFGIIDASNDSEWGFWSVKKYNGREIVNILSQLGAKHLDFAIGSHSHSDHIGGFIDIAGQYNNVDGNRLIDENTDYYYKPYKLLKYEPISYMTQEYYEKVIELIGSTGAELIDLSLISDPSYSFRFGDYDISLFNLAQADYNTPEGENDNSMVILISKGDIHTVILADCTVLNDSRVAQQIRSQISGRVSVLRNAHHGIGISNSLPCLQILEPENVIASKVSYSNGGPGHYFYYLVNGIPYYSTADATVAFVEDNTNGAYEIETFQDQSLDVTVRADRSAERIPDGFVYIKDKEGIRTMYSEANSLVLGWKLNPVTGYWHYFSDTENDNLPYMLKKQWFEEYGNWYYLDGQGNMATGWKWLDSNWYYLRSSGAMAVGWQWSNNYWYYLNSSGAMATGWKWVDNNWYYLKDSGAMAVGWQWIDNYWYYLNSSGEMATGWKWLAGNWYYLRSSGEMVTGWQRLNGTWYYFNASGALR